MPRWLETSITQRLDAGKVETATITHGQRNRETDGTVTKTGSDTVVQAGEDHTEKTLEREVFEDRKETTSDEVATITHGKTETRHEEIGTADETTTRTAQAHVLADTETGTTGQTQTQVEDAGAVISFRIRITGGLNKTSHPPI